MTTIQPEFLESDVYRAWQREQSKKTHAARQQLVDERQALLAQIDTAVTKHQREEVPLRAKAEAARAAFVAAEGAFINHLSAGRAPIASLERQCTNLETELNKSADRRIADARYGIYSKWESLRHSIHRVRTEPTGHYTADGLHEALRYFDNRKAIERLNAAMAAAAYRLDLLKLENPSDVEAAIAEILGSIPWDSLETLEPVE